MATVKLIPLLFILFFLSLADFTFAQESMSNDLAMDTIPDGLKGIKSLKNTRLGINVLMPIETLFLTEIEYSYEANVELPFAKRRFTGVFDFGMESFTAKNSDQAYQGNTNGYYFRLGGDYNLLHKKFEDGAVNVGLRYASANVNQSYNYSLGGQYWARRDYSISEKGKSASWIEFALGVRVKVFQRFYIGYTARVQFLININESSAIDMTNIPGYGAVIGNSSTSFGYHIFYSLGGKSK